MSTHSNNCHGDVTSEPDGFAFRADCGTEGRGFTSTDKVWTALALHEPPGRWAHLTACPRCGKYGADVFGDQDPSGWHMGCAADFAHEQERDHHE